jgi:ribosomal protein S18 acetylase RimI-like enzyme
MSRAERLHESFLRHAAAGRARSEVGPFSVFVTGAADSAYASVAVPRAGARVGAPEAVALRTAFAVADRPVVVEFVQEVAPELRGDLEAQGFAVSAELPLMVCEAGGLVPPPPVEGVTLQRVDAYSGADALHDFARVQSLGFAGEEPRDGDVAALPEVLEGGLGVLARVGAEPAGAGLFMAPVDGVTEVVGVAVREEFRERGVGSSLTAEVARLAFRAGAELVAIVPGGADAGRLYERLGFTRELTLVRMAG